MMYAINTIYTGTVIILSIEDQCSPQLLLHLLNKKAEGFIAQLSVW